MTTPPSPRAAPASTWCTTWPARSRPGAPRTSWRRIATAPRTCWRRHATAAPEDFPSAPDVVHPVAGRIAARSAADFMATNRDGTANVLEAARDGGARRFLLVSSLAVGGPTSHGHPIDEDRHPAPVTDYGRSKLAAEVLVRALASALPWTIVRPPVVYGEWDRGTLTIFKLAQRGIAPVFGDGSQELSVIHAEDLARALIAAATSPAAGGHGSFGARPGRRPCARSHAATDRARARAGGARRAVDRRHTCASRRARHLAVGRQGQ